MDNVILLWTDSLQRIKLTKLQGFLKKIASKDSGRFFYDNLLL